ncbi:MAG: nicotinamide riboside transporter PnuC [Bacteroidaceae bacterium]|nr:nicotinamide riboside transporter PnuC [Bacteroidaceae bacterium]
MMEFITAHGLDIITTILGLVYILLEYKASIWLWLVGIIMPALDIILYWQYGLYGDSAMAVYYMLAAIYGWIAWRFFKTKANGKEAISPAGKEATVPVASPAGTEATVPAASPAGTEAPVSEASASDSTFGISRMPLRTYFPAFAFFAFAWAITYYVLANYTNSTVPVLDAFTNALSFVGLWALAKKYIEQWFFWIIVDAICCYLYIIKGIPFKAFLYGLYVVIAVAGYFKWKKLAAQKS